MNPLYVVNCMSAAERARVLAQLPARARILVVYHAKASDRVNRPR